MLFGELPLVEHFEPWHAILPDDPGLEGTSARCSKSESGEREALVTSLLDEPDIVRPFPLPSKWLFSGSSVKELFTLLPVLVAWVEGDRILL